MNKVGAQTDHPPSMLYDVRHRLRTEVDVLGGAIAREARRHGIEAPLHTALSRLMKGKELPRQGRSGSHGDQQVLTKVRREGKRYTECPIARRAKHALTATVPCCSNRTWRKR